MTGQAVIFWALAVMFGVSLGAAVAFDGHGVVQGLLVLIAVSSVGCMGDTWHTLTEPVGFPH